MEQIAVADPPRLRRWHDHDTAGTGLPQSQISVGEGVRRGSPRVKFRTIVADPPWNIKGAGPLTGREGFGDAKGRSRPMPYPTMTTEQLMLLAVPSIVTADAHLYLWTINARIEEAYRLARAWCFRPSTLLVWAKNPMGGGMGGTYGLSTEFLLFCRRGRLPARERVGRSWFNWKRPYDERGKPKHSSKPMEAYTMIETVSPGPYLELFARRPREGWFVWGNEVESDIVLDAGRQRHRT